MDLQEYIKSGVLELYVAGVLSEEDNAKVYAMIYKHPQLLDEIERIEKTVHTLTASVAPKENKLSFKALLIKMIQEKEFLIGLKSKRENQSKRSKRLGWAAAVVSGVLLSIVSINNTSLNNELELVNDKKNEVKYQLEETEASLIASNVLLDLIRDKGTVTIALQGQAIVPDAFSKIYWNKNDKVVYADLEGLPKPPEGKVYQLWSLELNPLTPASLGVINDFEGIDNKIIAFDNPFKSQAFGLTLEPLGGSDSPTLDQLYVMGAVES